MKAISWPVMLLAAALIGGCRTAHPSSDRIPVKNGAAHLFSWGGGILVDVPKEYEVVKSQGPDFDVFTIRNTTYQGRWLGIYIGHQPMTHQIDGRDVQKIAVSLAREQANWLRTSEPLPAEFGPFRHDLYIEHLFDNHPQDSAHNVVVHVWTRGTLEDFSQVKTIVETIRLALNEADNQMPEDTVRKLSDSQH